MVDSTRKIHSFRCLALSLSPTPRNRLLRPHIWSFVTHYSQRSGHRQKAWLVYSHMEHSEEKVLMSVEEASTDQETEMHTHT